jgi:hypothetical protein
MQTVDIVWQPRAIAGSAVSARRCRAVRLLALDRSSGTGGNRVPTVAETIAAMRAAAPPGQPDVDAATRAQQSLSAEYSQMLAIIRTHADAQTPVVAART